MRAAVAILDFDILVGDCVTARYPADAQLPVADDKLSALCIPEGGHIFEEDHTFLFCKEPVTGDQVATPARPARPRPRPRARP